MQAHRIKTVVSSDGSVTVDNLPFQVGDEVEVIVLPHLELDEDTPQGNSLRDSVRRYDRPFDPAVNVNDWNAT